MFFFMWTSTLQSTVFEIVWTITYSDFFKELYRANYFKKKAFIMLKQGAGVTEEELGIRRAWVIGETNWAKQN